MPDGGTDYLLDGGEDGRISAKAKKEKPIGVRAAEKLKKEALAAVEALRVAQMDPKAVERQRLLERKTREAAAQAAVTPIIGTCGSSSRKRRVS